MFLLSAYNFFRAITLDPGTCPKPGNDAELKEVSNFDFLFAYLTHLFAL